MTKRATSRTRQPARPSAPGRGFEPVHRHRQATLRLTPRPSEGPHRFDHLKRMHD